MFKRGISLLLGMAMLLSCMPVSFAETGESAAVSAEPSAAAPSAALSAQTAAPAPSSFAEQTAAPAAEAAAETPTPAPDPTATPTPVLTATPTPASTEVPTAVPTATPTTGPVCQDVTFTTQSVTVGSASGVMLTGIAGASSLAGTLVIPATYGGAPVVSVNFDSAPQGNAITGMELPEGILQLSGMMTGFSSLTTLTLPSSLQNLGGNYAYTDDSGATIYTAGAFPRFYSLSALRSFAVTAGGAYSSQDGALYTNGGKTLVAWPAAAGGAVTVPAGVTAIRENAFRGNGTLTAVTLPAGLLQIGAGAFLECSALTDLTISGAYAVIDGTVAAGSVRLHGYDNSTAQKYAAANGLTFVSMGAIPADQTPPVCQNVVYRYYTTTLASGQTVANLTGIQSADSLIGELDIPAAYNGLPVSSVWLEGTLSNGVTKIVLPEGVKSIGGSWRMFQDLASISFPASLQEMHGGSFSTCSKLTDITFAAGSPFTVSDGAVYADGGKTLVAWPSASGSVTIPAGVTEIRAGVFYLNSGLTAVALPAGLEYMDDTVFNSCGNLTQITLPDGLKTIGGGTFANTGITAIDLPASVQSVGYGAFSNCPLTELTVRYAYTGFCDTVSGQIPAAATVRGYAGSTAEAYAAQQGAGFVSLGAIPAQQVPPVCTGVTYAAETKTINGQTGLVLTGILDGKILAGTLQIPSTYNGQPVIGVDFIGYSTNSITRIEIPEGVLSVTGGFSGFAKLTSVSLPASLTALTGAFSACTALTDVTFAGGAYSFAAGAFCTDNGKTLVSLTNASGTVAIPAGVTKIEDGAFSNNSRVTGVTLPDGLESIGSNAFANTALAGALTLPQSLRFVGACAFAYTRLTDLTVPYAYTYFDGADWWGLPAGIQVHGYAGSTAQSYAALEKATFVSMGAIPADQTEPVAENVQYTYSEEWQDGQEGVALQGISSSGSYGRLTIPSTYAGKPVLAVRFDSSDSDGTNAITSLVIPEGVKEIGGSFACVRAIQSVSLPASVNKIQGSSFFACLRLTDITVAAGGAYTAADGMLLGDAGKTLIAWPSAAGAVTVPAGIARLGEGAFAYNHRLTGITLPEGLTNIGARALVSCTGISSVPLPSTLKAIGANAFDSCTDISEITLPEGLTSIGSGAFRYSGLKTITVPAATIAVGSRAFASCASLTDFTAQYGYLYFGADVLAKSVTIHGYTGSTAQAYAAQNGQTFAELGAIPAGQTEPVVTDAAFTWEQSGSGITITGVTSETALVGTLTIPGEYEGQKVLDVRLDSSEAAGEENFVSRLVISDGIQNLSGSFYGWDGLQSVSIPGTVTWIDDGTFRECGGLADITIGAGSPYTVSSGRILGNGGQKLVSWPAASGDIVIPEGITGIGEYVFNGKQITSVSLPESLSYIGRGAFLACISLKQVVFPSRLREIGSYAFSGAPLTAVELPASVQTIGEGAFQRMSAAALSVTVRNPYAVFGTQAFVGDSSAVPASVVTLHGYAGSTAEEYAGANGHGFTADLGAIPAAWAQVRAYIGASIFSNIGADAAADARQAVTAGSDYRIDLLAGQQEGASLIYYQRFLDGTDTSQQANLGGTLTLSWYAADGTRKTQSFAGTLVADPLAQSICDAFGYTGTSRAIRYEIPEERARDAAEFFFAGTGAVKLEGTPSCTLPADRFALLNAFGVHWTGDGGSDSYSSYGSPSSQVDLTQDLPAYGRVNLNLLMPDHTIALADDYTVTASYAPAAGYAADTLTIQLTQQSTGMGSQYQKWNIALRNQGDTQGTLTVTAVSKADPAVRYTQEFPLKCVHRAVDLYAKAEGAPAALRPTTGAVAATDLADSATVYLRGLAGLTAAQSDPANWVCTSAQAGLTCRATAAADPAVTAGTGLQATMIVLTLSAMGADEGSFSVGIKDTSTGQIYPLWVQTRHSIERVGFNTDTYDLSAFAADRIYAQKTVDGRYVTADTATPGSIAAAPSAWVEATQNMTGVADGGYGDINVKLGEVYRMGASYAKICYNQAYEAVGWFWNIFSTEPSAAVTTENILGASAADPAVLAAARVDTKDAAGNDAPDIQLTGVAAGTTTVSYPIQDYAFHSVTQTAQQKVTVVGDLASMSLAGLSNATVGGAAALQLGAGTEQTLPKPTFTWVDGVPGIDSYQYYLCGDPAVATLTKNADGTTVLKATGTGTITLIAESTACRSNAAGCSWERLYADSEGYAKYAEIQVYVAESGIVGLQETGGHNGDSLFCRTNHPLSLTMQPVAASGASLPEGWYVQWTLTTSQPNAASITTSEADGRGTCTLTATNPDATGTLTASVYANGALCAQKQYALTFRLSGDCYDANGTVDVRDLLAAACQISGKAQLAGTNLLAADTNDDGTVDVVDLTRIAKFADGEADPSAAP